MSLKGKNAIITGSTSGIGHAMAEALAAKGVNIVLNGFGDKAEIDGIVAQIKKDFGVKCEYSAADMSKKDEVYGLVEFGNSRLGSVDILINNAGIQYTSPIEDFPDEKWDAIIAINLSSAFYGMKAVVPLMRKQGFGRIINTCSVHGLVASKNKIAYIAAKHGIAGMTKVVALETATDKNLTCNAICPGWTRTPLVEKQIDDRAAAEGIPKEQAIKELVGEKQPSESFVKPEQIGALAVFLCTDDAASMTGVCLPIDGGWTAQ